MKQRHTFVHTTDGNNFMNKFMWEKLLLITVAFSRTNRQWQLRQNIKTLLFFVVVGFSIVLNMDLQMPQNLPRETLLKI